jgi:maleylpyruvate isomerase
MGLNEEIAGCAAAHQRLLADLDAIARVDPRRSSLLPGWTIGHVLTHLARNADSHVRAFQAAGGGQVVDRYVGGKSGRAAEIEAGADRPAAELVADVRSTIGRLEVVWDEAPAAAWQGRCRETSGHEIPITDLPFLRWREVEVHHADLGLDFTFEDWSDAYVAAELAEQLPRLPDRLQPGTPDRISDLQARLSDRLMLAWLLGRWATADLPELTPWQ